VHIVKVRKGRNADVSHLYGACEKLGGSGLTESGRTPRIHFTDKFAKYNFDWERCLHVVFVVDENPL